MLEIIVYQTSAATFPRLTPKTLNVCTVGAGLKHRSEG